MQLDRNRIVIRERGLLDQLDLALCVIRVYAWPLAVALLAGILPFVVFNAWLLADLTEPTIDEPFPMRYMWCMLFLVVWEIPLATSLATLYLGEAVFLERPSMGNILRGLIRALPQLIWYQVLIRGLLIPMVLTLFLPFATWPFLNEVILLERTPMWRRHGQITTFRRSAALHGGNVGDLLLRWLVVVGFGFLLVAALWTTMNILVGLLWNQWDWEGATYTVYFPLALWIVIGYFTVVRFLGYLDLRIRREGWEIELMMRAEGVKLSRQLA
jgi:hypothetical protein